MTSSQSHECTHGVVGPEGDDLVVNVDGPLGRPTSVPVTSVPVS